MLSAADNIYFVWTGEVGFHVLTNSGGSFLAPASFAAVATKQLPPTSCLAIQLALICTIPHHACHDALANKWQLPFALCLHPPHPLRFIRLLALSLFPRSSLLFSALLSLSYWHRWKAVQYFYHSLLTRLSHATVAARSPSARHQTALCSLTLAFAR